MGVLLPCVNWPTLLHAWQGRVCAWRSVGLCSPPPHPPPPRTLCMCQLWDFATGKLLAEFKGHAGHAVSGLQFHPHEFVLASSSADRTVRLWDLETWQPLGAVGPEAQPMRGLAFHPGGGHLLAASQVGV